jgi:hypothetical protein
MGSRILEKTFFNVDPDIFKGKEFMLPFLQWISPDVLMKNPCTEPGAF